MIRYGLAGGACVLGLLGCTASAQVSPPPPSSGCAPDDAVVGCDSPSSGFSCGSAESPDQTDSSLVCSDATPSSDGLLLYCCIQFTSSSCAPDSSIQGCAGDSFGFSCTGPDTPMDADTSLNCSTPTPGGGGELLYCCTD
jgi:hypothetical protein